MTQAALLAVAKQNNPSNWAFFYLACQELGSPRQTHSETPVFLSPPPVASSSAPASWLT